MSLRAVAATAAAPAAQKVAVPAVQPRPVDRRQVLGLLGVGVTGLLAALPLEAQATAAGKERAAKAAAKKEKEKEKEKEKPKNISRQDELRLAKKERLAALKEKAASIKSGEVAPSF